MAGWLKDKRVRTQLLVGTVGLFLAGALYIAGIFVSLPKPEEITSVLQAAQSVQIYDRTGKILLSEAAGDKQRSILPREEIPDYARQATLAIEDASFYDHGAFEWKGVLRAITVNVVRGKLAQGGSTITQQLARNAFLTPEKTITRKVKEGVLAVRLEQYYDKDGILDLYLITSLTDVTFMGLNRLPRPFSISRRESSRSLKRRLWRPFLRPQLTILLGGRMPKT